MSFCLGNIYADNEIYWNGHVKNEHYLARQLKLTVQRKWG